MKFLNFIIFLNIIKITIQDLTISTPNELYEIFLYKQIKINYANYGKIPYGFFFTGKLFYDLKDKEDDYACKPLDKFHENFENKADRFPIIMVDRGNCSFVTKSRNVQNLGGSLALIVNNNEEENVDNILMVDDGTGSDIFIPTVIINKKDGEKIKQFLILHQNSTNPVLHDIIMNVDFDILQLDQVDFKLFFTSTHLSVYKLIKDISKYSNFIFNFTNFSPHYISYKSIEYDPKNNKTIQNCIAKGLYCALPRYDLGILDGRDIITEDIRQKCIYNIANGIYKSKQYEQIDNSKKIYFDYMIGFFDRCLNKTEKQFNFICSKDVMEKLGINYNLVFECATNSYINDVDKNVVDLDNNNKMLEEEKKVRSLYKIKILPSILINNKTISSTWNTLNLLEAICAGFKERPYICTEILYEFTNSSKGNDIVGLSFGTYFFIILMLILLNLVIFYVCRMYLNKRIGDRIENVDMNGRINSVVTNYLRLKSETQ